MRLLLLVVLAALVLPAASHARALILLVLALRPASAREVAPVH